MRHVAPHRLAAYCQGGLSPSAMGKVQSHVESCSQCQRALRTIGQGHTSMAEIAKQEVSDLRWDHVAARIYWSMSSGRLAQRRGQSKLGWRVILFASVAASIMLGVGIWAMSRKGNMRVVGAETSVATHRAVSSFASDAGPVAAEMPPTTRAAGVVFGAITFAQGQVFADGEPIVFDRKVAPNTRFSTAKGKMVIQFGERSSFRLAAQSELYIRTFDSQRIELEIDGVVDVDIERRPIGQEFVVAAGDQRVLVRGTAFRVDFQDDELDVSCVRGAVVVTDGLEQVRVSAGQEFRLLDSAWNDAARLRPSAMTTEQIQSLSDAMAMFIYPNWNLDERNDSSASSVLHVSAADDQTVAVDGLPVAAGSFRLRVSGGRHEIATMDDEGGLQNERWIHANAGENLATELRVADGLSQNRSATFRKRELQDALSADDGTTRCFAPLVKQGLMSGAYAVFHVGINADGSQSFLNIVDSNLSPLIERCLRNAVDEQLLPIGPIAQFRLRLSL